MEKRNNRLGWKAKKYIVQIFCLLVVVCTIGISLADQSSFEQDILAREEYVEGKRMEETLSSTNLYMDYSVVEESSEADDTLSGERIDTSEVETGKTETVEKNDIVDKEGLVAESDAKQNASKKVAKKSSGTEKKNRVVSNVSKVGATKANHVEQNEQPLYLIEHVFENHGVVPEMGNSVKKYQFPIEIGYAVDRNYDGKNNAGDFILNKVYDTEKEIEEEQPVTEDSLESSTEEGAIEEESSTTEEKSIEGEVSAAEEELIETETSAAEQNSSENEVTSETESVEESTREENSTEQDKKSEEEKLETYRKDVWKQILQTETVDVEIKEQQGSVVVAEEDTTDVVVSGDAMVSGDALEVVEKEITAGYYIVKGTVGKDSDIFVSDIEITPTGEDGFNQVRIGEDGEFASSVLITEDAIEKDLKLYFSDGKQITEATIFTYSKDTEKPELKVQEDGFYVIQSMNRTIYFTNQNDIPLQIIDGSEKITDTLEQVHFLYADQMEYVKEGFEESKVTIEEDFYGRILLNCKDKAGNVSDIQSQFVLIDHNKPEITIAQDERCSAPYTLWVTISEIGNIVSGIQTIQCVVNGEIYDVTDAVVNETYMLDEALEVSSKVTFPIELQEVGSHAIQIKVTDYAGNETIVENIIEVTEPEMVSVFMPKNFTIHIDPQQLAGKEQIYSDNVELKNVSKFDVCVQIDEVILYVNDEVSDEGIVKDCEIYLVAPDTGERIKLSKGSNKNIYSYRLPPEVAGDIANLRFVGTTTEGSDRMWKGSDISLQVKLSFRKWEE